jgi:lysophospholipase L1-like esterase
MQASADPRPGYSFCMPSAIRSTLVALGSVTVLGTAAATGRYLVIRRRTGGMVRLAEAIPVNSAYWREQRRRSGELLYVAIGDSAAQGIGASRPHHSYVGLLARFIRRSTSRSVRVVNLSQSGARLREAIEKQVPAIGKLDPDIVTVCIGANDIAQFDAKRFERELRIVLAAVPKHAIVADLPCFYFGESERRVQVANEIVRRLASERGLVVAPLHERTRVRTAARVALRDVAADFFHPNDRGYIVWASAFEPLLKAALRRLPAPVAPA